MPVRLINTSREVIEFPTVQEAYDFVLTLEEPMAFRTDAPSPVCIPIDPESSPNQLTERTYAILRKYPSRRPVAKLVHCFPDCNCGYA